MVYIDTQQSALVQINLEPEDPPKNHQKLILGFASQEVWLVKNY